MYGFHIALRLLSTNPAQVLDPLNAANPVYLMRQDELGRVCGVWKKLLQSCVFEGSHLILSEYPATSADFGDEYQGSSNSSRVRIKRLYIMSKK